MPLSDIKLSYSKIKTKIEAKNDIKYNKKTEKGWDFIKLHNKIILKKIFTQFYTRKTVQNLKLNILP